MPNSPTEILTTLRQSELGLVQIVNSIGFWVSVLPNGTIFTMEQTQGSRQIMINQALASPIASGMGRLYLRTGGSAPMIRILALANGPS